MPLRPECVPMGRSGQAKMRVVFLEGKVEMSPLRNYLDTNANLKPVQYWTQGLCLLVIVGIGDYETGWELSFFPLYFLPIFVVSWNGKAASGITMAAACAVTWFILDLMDGHPYSFEFFRYWNAAIRFLAFDVVALLVVQVRAFLNKEREDTHALSLAYEQLKASQEQLVAETAARIEALDQLRHADRLKTVGRLAAGVAHELGTPLSVIAGRAQFILAADSIDAPTRRNAAIIEQQTERISRIVQQLLDYARQHTATLASFDLRVAVAQSLEILRPLAKRYGVSLEPRMADNPVTAPMDVAQIQQVLSNLVINSIQAMPGGGYVTVEVRESIAAPPGGPEGPARAWASFSVADEGEGISPEHMELLFDPFFTTKDTGQGTGLGLSIAHGIVGEHGGWIDVASQQGNGSRFTVYLPLES